jgi:hypothetical protein
MQEEETPKRKRDEEHVWSTYTTRARFLPPRRIEEVQAREPTVVVSPDDRFGVSVSPPCTMETFQEAQNDESVRSLTPVVSTGPNVSWVDDPCLARKFVEEVTRVVDKMNTMTGTDASLFDAYQLIIKRLVVS